MRGWENSRRRLPRERNLWLLLIFVFINTRNITIQGVYKSNKFYWIPKFWRVRFKEISNFRNIYVAVTTLLVCFRNRHQDFPLCLIQWFKNNSENSEFHWPKMLKFLYFAVFKNLFAGLSVTKCNTVCSSVTITDK